MSRRKVYPDECPAAVMRVNCRGGPTKTRSSRFGSIRIRDGSSVGWNTRNGEAYHYPSEVHPLTPEARRQIAYAMGRLVDWRR